MESELTLSGAGKAAWAISGQNFEVFLILIPMYSTPSVNGFSQYDDITPVSLTSPLFIVYNFDFLLLIIIPAFYTLH